MPRLGGVVLAAGLATRLGGRPKCLLELDGEPLLRRVLAALDGAGIADRVVVTGHAADRVEAALHGLPLTVVRNPAPDEGQTASLRLGLAALPAGCDAVLVALADQPLLDAADLHALRDAWERRAPGIEVVHPRVAGARGNPVIFSAAVRDAVLAAGPDVGARQWQAAHPAAVAAFDSDNDHYRIDIDTPEDLARFAAGGRALRWPPGLGD